MRQPHRAGFWTLGVPMEIWMKNENSLKGNVFIFATRSLHWKISRSSLANRDVQLEIGILSKIV